ncbi:hypothetical protein J2S47_005798 [Streptomyces griseoviridis]|uniref:Uncharacterized protein n=1 Tax=Streptomyces griseoviridis TaxID=45398 RepID=A0ABT9LP36_STRGD|nr:hypothetical protein [Streptomyces griseoviridis]
MADDAHPHRPVPRRRGPWRRLRPPADRRAGTPRSPTGVPEEGVVVQGDLAVEGDGPALAVRTSGSTSTSRASSRTSASPQPYEDVGGLRGRAGRFRHPGRLQVVIFSAGSTATRAPPRGAGPRPPRSPCRPRRGRRPGSRPPPGPGTQETRDSLSTSTGSATMTAAAVRPLTSMPRTRRAAAGSAVRTTPPALPRPPVLTCDLTTVRPPGRRAVSRARSGESVTSARETAMPCSAESRLARRSNRPVSAPVCRCRAHRGSGDRKCPTPPGHHSRNAG